MLKFIAFLVFSFEIISWAQFDPICNQSSIHSFKVQIDSTRSFLYHYRYLKAANNKAPLIIYIPGGPGATTIGAKDPRISLNYSVILTDPRGSGCNDSTSIMESDISSEKIADDLVELIKDLKPQKYIIHGHSHGSVVATILSSKLSRAHFKTYVNA